MELEFYIFIFALGGMAGVAFFRKVQSMLSSAGCNQTTQTAESTADAAVDSSITEELLALRTNEQILEGTISDLELVVENLRGDLAEKTRLLNDSNMASDENDLNYEADNVGRAIDFEPFDPASADPQQLFIRNKELSSQLVEIEDRLYETQQCLLDKVEQLNEIEKCRHVEIATPSPLQSITRVNIPLEADMSIELNMTPRASASPQGQSGAFFESNQLQSNSPKDADSSLSPLKTILVEVEEDVCSNSVSSLDSTDAVDVNPENLFVRKFDTCGLSQQLSKESATLEENIDIFRTFGNLDLSQLPPAAPPATTKAVSEVHITSKPAPPTTVQPLKTLAYNTQEESSVVSSRRTSCSSADNSKFLDSVEDRVAMLKQKMQRMKDLGIERRM